MNDEAADAPPPAESGNGLLVRHLRELIAAIDRRVPHMERGGEIDIARDAALLREKAVERIAVEQSD